MMATYVYDRNRRPLSYFLVLTVRNIIPSSCFRALRSSVASPLLRKLLIYILFTDPKWETGVAAEREGILDPATQKFEQAYASRSRKTRQV
ncbi:hypothetical protein NDU88_005509 [Pleurodeles waltl]|uniref:Uncharacterized protein n=1 Tax=Pleurodeles waltl TaxID=8319 RepID=A0AAV7SLV2_PLEWA|nr:hypothetical protein NDU88_005509 [Pleurodeles waltl]